MSLAATRARPRARAPEMDFEAFRPVGDGSKEANEAPSRSRRTTPRAETVTAWAVSLLLLFQVVTFIMMSVGAAKLHAVERSYSLAATRPFDGRDLSFGSPDVGGRAHAPLSPEGVYASAAHVAATLANVHAASDVLVEKLTTASDAAPSVARPLTTDDLADALRNATAAAGAVASTLRSINASAVGSILNHAASADAEEGIGRRFDRAMGDVETMGAYLMSLASAVSAKNQSYVRHTP